VALARQADDESFLRARHQDSDRKRLTFMSTRPTPCASYQCTSAIRRSPWNSILATPLPLAPSVSTESFPERLQFADPTTGGDRLYVANLADNPEVHAC